MPSRVVSLRLREGQVERLQRLARQMGRTASETAAILVEEALRRGEFAFIEFRDSPVGRQAYVSGSSLAVWEVAMVARSYGGDVARVAEHLGWPAVKVQAALQYAAAYPQEIAAAVRDNDAGIERLGRMLPSLDIFTVPPP